VTMVALLTSFLMCKTKEGKGVQALNLASYNSSGRDLTKEAQGWGHMVRV
jgi:hypothetical protein